MFCSRLILPAIAASALFATSVAAQPVPQGGATADEVAGWLRGQGLDAQVAPETTSPRVQSGANGVSWDMIGFDCAAGRCRAWQFSTAFLLADLPDDVIPRWNAERRYLRAFEIPRDGQPVAVAQYDVLLVPGSTWEGLTEHMRLFAGTAPLFAVAVGAATAP